MLALFFDFETNGMPLWREPSDHDDQPHIVQAAATLVDTETRKTVGGIDMIARPDGAWEIPEEVEKIHGISTEYAERVGLPEAFVVHCLWCLWEQSDFRVAHNVGFDDRIMRIALKRFYGDQGPIDPTGQDQREPADIWKDGESACTALMATPIMKMAATPAMVATGRKHSKRPKLTEAFEFFCGVPMEDAHTAMADVRACRAVYFAIQDYEDPNEPAPEKGEDKSLRPPNAGDGDGDVSFLGGD